MYKHSRMTIPTSGTHLGGRDGGGRDVGGPCGGGGKAINQVSSIKFDTCWRLFTTGAVQQCMPTCLLLLSHVLWCGPWAPVSGWALRGDLPLYMVVSLNMGSHALKVSCLRNRASHWLAQLEPDPALKIRCSEDWTNVSLHPSENQGYNSNQDLASHFTLFIFIPG